MNNKKGVFIILLFLVVVAATWILGKYCSGLLFQAAVEHDPSQFPSGSVPKFNWKLYVQIFFILFAALCCPFIFSVFPASVHKQNLWKWILAMEAAGLLLVILTSPPDLISRIISYVLWQLPVLVNLFVLRSIIRKKGSE